MEQISYNMLFRWFIGSWMDALVWDVTVFTKNRDRLLDGDVARLFLLTVIGDTAVNQLLSNEYFSVDGTLIEAWASMKSFQRKDGGGEPPAPGRNGERNFHGEKRSNATPPTPRIPRRGCAVLASEETGQRLRCFGFGSYSGRRAGAAKTPVPTRSDLTAPMSSDTSRSQCTSGLDRSPVVCCVVAL